MVFFQELFGFQAQNEKKGKYSTGAMYYFRTQVNCRIFNRPKINII